MEQNMPAAGGKSKKIIIIAGVVLIAVAAVMTVLGGLSQNGSSSLPGRSLSGTSTSFNSPVPSMKSAGMIAERNSSELIATDESSFEATDKKIIKNGDLSLKVSSADDANQKIANIAKANGGEVVSSNFYQTEQNVKSGTVTVKVSVANFEKAFAELKKVATLVVQESTSGQDVTEQYADLQAQLRNKQAEEQSFMKILERSGTIDEILKVTRELSRARGEIERLQGRIKFMDLQTDMSSISVSLTEDTNITFSDSWRPWQVVKETFNGLVKSVQGFVNFLIVLIIQVIPVLVLYLLIFFVIYRIGKKIYLKIKNKSN